MSMRNAARLGLPILFLALAATPACKGVPQPPQVETAGLRIDVESARQRRRGVVVEIRVWNDFDQSVSFENGNVRLIHGDREVSAKPYRSWRRGTTVQPKSNLDFRWLFETGEPLPQAQSYDIEIRDLMIDDVPAGDTAVFTINL